MYDLISVLVLVTAAAACAAVVFAFRRLGPRAPEVRVADEDLELVREADRARWRRVGLRTYKIWKRQDDYYLLAAYRKRVAAGMPEQEAKTAVRRELPLYYLDAASRDTEGFTGDDGALPVLLRERVDRNARVLIALMQEQDDRFRTMNALVRECLRKRALP